LWTAWPSASEDVPRERDGAWEDSGLDGESRKRKKDPRKAGEDIEDILVGVVLKTARERFQADYPPGQKEKSPSPSSSSSSRSSSSEESESETTSSSSQPSTPSDPRRPKDPILTFNPTPLTDDTLATSILLPTIRHILSKLDTLLTGLHHARQASLRINDDSASETQTDLEYSHSSEGDSGPRSRSNSKNKRKGRSRSRSRAKQQRSKSKYKGTGKVKAKSNKSCTLSTATASDSDSDSNSDSDPESKSPAPPANPRSPSPNTRARILARRQMRLGLRDWSDVLGIAALQGWDAAVIDAAARRCASLFGEGMDFRVLRAEDEGRKRDEVEEVVRYVPGGGRRGESGR